MAKPRWHKVTGGNFALDKNPEPTTEDILREQLKKRSARIAELEGRLGRPDELIVALRHGLAETGCQEDNACAEDVGLCCVCLALAAYDEAKS